MEECCNVLHELSTVICSLVEECEDISKYCEEGIERGRKYERLLLNMKDKEYVGQ